MKITRFTHNSAFSMVELMTVVAIIAILAAITIPGFINYITAAKLQSLWKLGDPAKLYVESQYYKNNADLNGLTVNAGTQEFTTSPDPDLVKCITIQDGIVSVVGNPDGFYGHEFWIAWVPSASNGALQWYCSYAEEAKDYIESGMTNCVAGGAQYTADAGCL